MHSFDYVRPTTREEAADLLSLPTIMVLAGGSDLLSLIKAELFRPVRVVDIKGVSGLDGLAWEASKGLRAGALVTLETLRTDSTVVERYPALSQAAGSIHSPQVRNVATLGGNLCQWPRCWYFRAGFGLPTVVRHGLTARDGDNRHHAIFKNDELPYVHPSSLLVALVALGATIKAFGKAGPRDIAADAFSHVPGSQFDRPHVLTDDEIVTDVLLPPPGSRVSAFYEVRQRQALDWPIVSAAASFALEDGRVKAPRLVLGHVAPIAWPVPEAEKVLDGAVIDEPTLDRMADAAVKDAKPMSRNGYKVRVARAALKRAVRRAAGLPEIPA